MSLRQLLPSCQDNPDLAALYAYPDGQWLRANMVSSADGAAALDGTSAGLSARWSTAVVFVPGIGAVSLSSSRVARPQAV